MIIIIVRRAAKSQLLLISKSTYVGFAEMGSINIKDSKETRNHRRHLKKQTNRKNSGKRAKCKLKNQQTFIV